MMRELTNKRAIASMPVAGSYRAIDFALSNMSNSHIQKVAVITQYNARSLNEHLSSSKWWDFGRKQGGLYVFTPTITAESSSWYRGTADSLYQNIDFLKSSHEPYVVIASGDGIYKLDYNKILQYHIEKKADVTVVVKKLDNRADIGRYGVVAITDEGRITDIDEKPLETNHRICGRSRNICNNRNLLIGKSIDKRRFATVGFSKNSYMQAVCGRCIIQCYCHMFFVLSHIRNGSHVFLQKYHECARKLSALLLDL